MSYLLWHFHSSSPGYFLGQSLAMNVDSGYSGLMWFSFAYWESNGMMVMPRRSLRIYQDSLRFEFKLSRCLDVECLCTFSKNKYKKIQLLKFNVISEMDLLVMID